MGTSPSPPGCDAHATIPPRRASVAMRMARIQRLCTQNPSSASPSYGGSLYHAGSVPRRGLVRRSGWNRACWKTVMNVTSIYPNFNQISLPSAVGGTTPTTVADTGGDSASVSPFAQLLSQLQQLQQTNP